MLFAAIKDAVPFGVGLNITREELKVHLRMPYAQEYRDALYNQIEAAIDKKIAKFYSYNVKS